MDVCKRCERELYDGEVGHVHNNEIYCYTCSIVSNRYFWD